MWDSQSSRGDRRVCAPTYPRPLTRVTFMQGRSGCCCVGWEGWARTNDNAVHSRALYRLSYSPMFCFSAGSRYCFGMGSERVAEDMKRTKKSRETPDPHQVFNHGLRFLTTDQAVRRIFGGDPNWSPVIAPPTMVLSAFASELLLKCLLIIETGEAPDNIHELHTLFGKLKHKTKRHIEEIWDAECRGKIEGLAKLQGVVLRKIGSHRPRSFVTCRTASEKVFCPNMPNTKGVVASHAPSRMVRKCTHSMSKCIRRMCLACSRIIS